MKTTKSSSYALRLPVSLKAAVEKWSKQDGVSINQFVVLAVAEKVSAMETAQFFETRRERAGDREVFRRLLTRPTGDPMPGDELPEDLADMSATRLYEAE